MHLDNTRLPILVIGPSIAYIPLTQGYFALIDSEDAHLVGTWKWLALDKRKSSAGVRPGRGVWDKEKKQPRVMHLYNLIMPPPSGKIIDHINRNPLDNRKANLRPATPKENRANSSPRPNQHGMTGIDFHRNKFRVRVWIDGKQREIGSRNTLEDAIKLRSTFPDP